MDRAIGADVAQWADVNENWMLNQRMRSPEDTMEKVIKDMDDRRRRKLLDPRWCSQNEAYIQRVREVQVKGEKLSCALNISPRTENVRDMRSGLSRIMFHATWGDRWMAVEEEGQRVLKLHSMEEKLSDAEAEYAAREVQIHRTPHRLEGWHTWRWDDPLAWATWLGIQAGKNIFRAQRRLLKVIGRVIDCKI